MKPNSIKSTVFAKGWRCGAVMLASVCLVWVAFVSSEAQHETLKRVTSLELGQAAEGARVTIVSDSALNDYEAFRRGDRFYVKIPQAEIAFSQPRFSGDGFDDVQVQKVEVSVAIRLTSQVIVRLPLKAIAVLQIKAVQIDNAPPLGRCRPTGRRLHTKDSPMDSGTK